VGSYFGRTFYALGNGQYRILWFGTLFSFLGMQMQVMARGYLAYDLTHRNSALGGVMLAFGIPQLVLGLWGGVLADRVPKRRLLVFCHAIVAANSAWLAFMIATGRVEFWMLIVAGFIQGGGFAFIGPARQAFISDLVGKEAIGNAVVLQQLSMNSTRVIGPSLAGTFIAISFIGIGGVYVMTTLGFVIAAVTMLRLPPGNPIPRANRLSALGDMRAGLSYVKGRPAVAILILTSFMVVMIGFPYQSFLPSVARDVYHVDAGGLGNLQSVGAVGAVIATVVVATYAGHSRAWFFQPVLGVAFGVSLMVLALAPHFITGLLAMFFVGGLASSFQSLNNSLTMSMSDQEYHGRVQSISMLSWSLFGIVALPIGMVADRIGIRETISLMGATVILAVIIIQAAGRIRNVAEDRYARPPLRDSSGMPAGGH